jgi:hypothetical protein
MVCAVQKLFFLNQTMSYVKKARTIARIDVPQRLGVYLHFKNKILEFYIRSHHSSQKLNQKDSHEYLREREMEQTNQPKL